MESAAGVANFSMVDDLDAVEYTFAQAAKDGQTTVRIFAHGINSTLPLQPSPGKRRQEALSKIPFLSQHPLHIECNVSVCTAGLCACIRDHVISMLLRLESALPSAW